MHSAAFRAKKKRQAPKKKKNVKQEIRFYRASDKPYGAFSNLFQRSITFEGRKFPTAEHAYQAGKAKSKKVREWILSAPAPSLVAMAAHGLYTWNVISNWSQIKYARMRKVLHAKFSQHEDLRRLLLSTANARLIEAPTVDNEVSRTWGEINGKGRNVLGVLLMDLRTTLRKKRLSSKSNRTRAVSKKKSRRSVYKQTRKRQV